MRKAVINDSFLRIDKGMFLIYYKTNNANKAGFLPTAIGAFIIVHKFFWG